MSSFRHSSRQLLWLVPLMGWVLVACGAPANRSTLPPTAAIDPGSTPTPQPSLPAPTLTSESPHCYIEAKDPTTGTGLSDVDCTTATQLALADARVQRLLDGLSYHWQQVVLWSGGKDLFGAMVTLELEQPASVSGEWLSIAQGCTDQASLPYHSVPYRQAGKNLRQVSVWVDLNRHQVVGIEPNSDPRYRWTPTGTPEPVGDAAWPTTTCPGD